MVLDSRSQFVVQQLTDIQLRKLAKKIPPDKFGEIGTNLGLTNPELQVILADCRTTPERIYQMLLKWRDRTHKSVNQEDYLSQVLQQCDLILIHGDHDFVYEFEISPSKYNTLSPLTISAYYQM